LLILGMTLAAGIVATRDSQAGIFHRGDAAPEGMPFGPVNLGCEVQHTFSGEPGGTWYWMRSPDEEKRVIMGLFTRYCIRCHAADGRGVWDIPNIPNFTNVRWQASRSDAQIARIVLEGRGAVMPPFRGTLTLEEAWGMARYLRTFVPGTETPRPDLGPEKKGERELPPPKKDK
jgi:hypothetical protein